MISPMPVTVEWTMKRRRAPKQRPTTQVVADQECIPRIARLMALAIKFDALIRQGVGRDYADLARLGHVSRARITQIMNLLNLAPDIQEEILRFEGANKQTEAFPERKVRALTTLVDWQAQRGLWRKLNEKLARLHGSKL
jgi:hypothetical protein